MSLPLTNIMPRVEIIGPSLYYNVFQRSSPIPNSMFEVLCNGFHLYQYRPYGVFPQFNPLWPTVLTAFLISETPLNLLGCVLFATIKHYFPLMGKYVQFVFSFTELLCTCHHFIIIIINSPGQSHHCQSSTLLFNFYWFIFFSP